MNRLRNLFELWGITGLVIFGVCLLLPGVSWGLLGLLWTLGSVGQIAAIALTIIAATGIVGWLIVEGVAYALEVARRFRLWRLGIVEEAELYEEAARPSDIIRRSRAECARVSMRRWPRFFRGA